MVDIAQFDLVEPDPIEWDQYQEAGEYAPPPPKGEYMGQAPPSWEFGAGKERQLLAKGTVTIKNGPADGYEVRYVTISNKKYKNRNASQMADYLRACGIASRPGSNQEFADLMASTCNRVFKFSLDWDAYCKDCGWSYTNGMAGFPVLPSGEHQPSIECPHCGQSIRARAKIDRYVSAVEGA